jgi:hypothetical protein
MKEDLMKRLLVSLLGSLVVITLVQSVPTAQETRQVQGTITAIGASSVTVKAAGKEMVFNVDAKTDITTPGGSTKSRAAEAAGKTGLKLDELLKVGQGVEVRYHEQGMHAASIRTLPSPPAAGTAGAAAPRSQTVNGVVTAVSTTAVTIKTASGPTEFTVDGNTRVIGSGASTTSRQKEAAGQKTVITDFVGVGDTVDVTHREGAKVASEVRVRVKAKTDQ